jgi:hypothetical protein
VEVIALRAEIVEEVLRIVVVAVVAHRIAALLRAVAVRHRTAVVEATLLLAPTPRLRRARALVAEATHPTRVAVAATLVADSFNA